MSFVLAGYVDVEQIGRGGIGDVYRARRASTGATVAIKVLRDVSDGSAAWRRARRELAALVSLAGHAHVVQVEEVLEVDGRPALVMEHLPGGSVGALLARRGGALEHGPQVTTVAGLPRQDQRPPAALVRPQGPHRGRQRLHRDGRPGQLPRADPAHHHVRAPAAGAIRALESAPPDAIPAAFDLHQAALRAAGVLSGRRCHIPKIYIVQGAAAHRGGAFQATDLLIKCPSKYEGQTAPAGP